ncbi:MAG: carboxymuconolactone decarboxylase family protein [Thermohalobaculum sp.]|nr:carboxymuconolactone decarboxylase family protein [Thermohalobaculum sp.]
MTQRIPALKDADLSPDQRAALDQMRDVWGAPWNIGRTMANNPQIVRGFLGFWQAIDQSGLQPMDREVICFEMAAANGCHYCIPAHRAVAKSRGLDLGPLERIAAGEELAGDSRPAILQRLVRRLVATKGKLDDAELAAARETFSNAELIAIVAEIAHCVFTNSLNRLADTEIDAFLPRAPIA